MFPIAYPFLFIASMFGTRWLGLERTVRGFQALGQWQGRMHCHGRPKPVARLRERIQRGYRLLPLPIECLDQAIVTWYLLNLNQHAARLKVGLSLTPMFSHAWVETPGEVFGAIPGVEDLGVVAEYAPWTSC